MKLDRVMSVLFLFLPCVTCVVSREVYSEFYRVATHMTAAALNLSNRATTVSTLLSSLDDTLASSVQALVNQMDQISERVDDSYLSDLLQTNLNEINKDSDDAMQILNQTLDAFQISALTAEMSLHSLMAFVDAAISFLDTYRSAFNQCSVSRNYCLVSWTGCEDVVRSSRSNRSGIYQIHLCPGCPPIPVYCDMETDGGGWTVIQRIGATPESHSLFNQSWINYAKGFGNLNSDFWLGNELLHLMTSLEDRTMLAHMTTKRGNKTISIYNNFKISSSKDSYKLRVCGFHGNGTNFLSDGSPFIASNFPNSDLHFDVEVGWWVDKSRPNHNLNALLCNESLSQSVMMIRSSCFPVKCSNVTRK